MFEFLYIQMLKAVAHEEELQKEYRQWSTSQCNAMQIRKRLKTKSEAPCCQNFAYAFALTQMSKACAY